MFQDADYIVRRPADFDYDTAIAELEEKVARKKHVTSRLAHFEVELTRLTRLEECRRAELDLENADVAALQKISPAFILCTITGQKAEKLAREEAEALAAAARYETVKGDLSYVRERIGQLSAELRKLGNCERKLDELLQEKKQLRMAQDAAYAEQTAELETAILEADRGIDEISRALDKGGRVRGILRGICNQLDRAYSLTGADVLCSRYAGSFLLDAEKHECLDAAQAMLEKLGQYMQEFAAELTDVDLDARDLPASVNLSDGLRTMDRFFDNVFTDILVRRRIADSKGEMESLLDRIDPIVDALAAAKTASEEKRTVAVKRLEAFIQAN